VLNLLNISGEKIPGRLRYRWENNNKIELKKTGH
jgi:hypothetical protein